MIHVLLLCFFVFVFFVWVLYVHVLMCAHKYLEKCAGLVVVWCVVISRAALIKHYCNEKGLSDVQTSLISL